MDIKIGEYKTIWRIKEGGCGEVFLAEKEGEIKKKAYILKTFLNNDNNDINLKILKNEIKILKEINPNVEHPIPFIPAVYWPDKDENINTTSYYVIDYFSHGNLLDYIENSNGFLERTAKMIFKKIVERIQFCHNKNICHLDIKPANIVFDNEFEPIIIDFGLSLKINDGKIYEGKTGTEQYECPEMWEKGKFTGVEADIFSLGALLFNLIAPSYGFWHAKKDDPYYSLIIEDKEKVPTYQQYWNKILPLINNIELSEDFKNLYTKMIAYESKNRPTIEEILAHPWFNEIKNLSKEVEKKEIAEKLGEIYNKIKECNPSIKNLEQKIENYDHRGPDYKNVFPNPELRAKKIPNDIINPNRHIIIDGYLDEREFMNNLYYCIYNKSNDLAGDLSINPSDEELRLEVIFETENKYHENCAIDIELFKYGENRYLLDFLRRSGNLSDYYKNFRKIKDIIQFGKIQDDNKSNNNELSL